MAYLATFHWGWLLASLLLGLAMGWVAVVHRGQAVSKPTSRWLAGLAGGRAAGGCGGARRGGAGARDPGPSGLLARSRSHHVCIISFGLRGWIVAARLGG